MELVIRELSHLDEAAFLKGFLAYDPDDYEWHSFLFRPGDNYENHLERLRKNKMGIDLPSGHVPCTMFYAFLGNEIVGRVNIRHELNDFLYAAGGNIGYAVLPSFRKSGFATRLLEHALLYCQDILHLEKVLITCDDENIASWKVIEKFGGVLENKHVSNGGQKIKRRYWINF